MIPDTTIIGLVGPLGGGKSFLAAYLEKEYGFAIHKFATPLKNMLRAIDLTEEMIEGAEKEKPQEDFCGVTPRHMMQTLGAEWGRAHIHPDFWVRMWANGLPFGRAVADDCRYANEANYIRSKQGVLIRVVPTVFLESETGTHSSEAEWSNMDVNYELTNDMETALVLSELDEILAREGITR